MICHGSTSAGMRVDCRLSDDLMADYAVNELMRPVHEAVQGTLAVTSLRPDLQEIVDAGPVRRSGRIYLSHYARGAAAGSRRDGPVRRRAVGQRRAGGVILAGVRPCLAPARPPWRRASSSADYKVPAVRATTSADTSERLN
jgi:hypothetical protein